MGITVANLRGPKVFDVAWSDVAGTERRGASWRIYLREPQLLDIHILEVSKVDDPERLEELLIKAGLPPNEEP